MSEPLRDILDACAAFDMTDREAADAVRDAIEGPGWRDRVPDEPWRDLRNEAIGDALRESMDAHERALDRERAAWITGGASHRREAERGRAWAEFMAAAAKAAKETP